MLGHGEIVVSIYDILLKVDSEALFSGQLEDGSSMSPRLSTSFCLTIAPGV